MATRNKPYRLLMIGAVLSFASLFLPWQPGQDVQGLGWFRGLYDYGLVPTLQHLPAQNGFTLWGPGSIALWLLAACFIAGWAGSVRPLDGPGYRITGLVMLGCLSWNALSSVLATTEPGQVAYLAGVGVMALGGWRAWASPGRSNTSVSTPRAEARVQAPAMTGGVVSCSGEATPQEAQWIAEQLTEWGYFRNHEASVYLARSGGHTALTFVVSEGSWDSPELVASFETMARALSGSIGGLPLTLRLVNPAGRTGLERRVG